MNTQSRVLKWVLIVGIVLVLNMFFNYSLSLIYKSPDYTKYVPQTQVIDAVNTKEECLKIGGQWNANVRPYPDAGNISAPMPIGVSTGYCDPNFTREQEFIAAEKVYDRNVFITLVLLGALCVAAGSLLKKNELIKIALSLAGVFSFVIASMRYWGSANDLIKVIILAIALTILIWVAIKKFQDAS